MLKDYKEHRENVLFDKEKSLLPASQPYAERELRARAKKNEVTKVVEEKNRAYETFCEEHRGYTFVATALERISAEMDKVVPHIYKRYGHLTPLLYLQHHQRGRICDYPCHGNLNNGACNICCAKTCETCGYKYFPRPSRMNIEQHVCREDHIEKEKARKALLATYCELMSSEDALEYMQLKPQVDNFLRRYDREIAKKRREMRLMPDVGVGVTIPSIEKEKRTFVRACPVNECRGFLSTAWKCGICENFTCSQCHEVKGKSRDAPHVCLEENVETAKLLAKDTKPCPNCGTRIFKLNGCDQMWCTECHTGFSWSTGEVERGNIHNPHYYEFLRRNNGRGGQPREIRDIPCGGLPDYTELYQKFKKLLPSDDYVILEPFHRVIGEVMDLRTWYRRRNLEDKREIRVKYLLKDYDDVQFKRMLQMKAKAQDKITNIDQVLDMFVMASTSILQRVRDISTKEQAKEILIELEELRKYMNTSMEKISVVYDCKTPSIDPDIQLHKVGERKQW